MCRVSIVGVSGKASVDRRGQTNKALRNQLISPSWVFLNSGVNPTVFVYGTETLCKPLHRPSSLFYTSVHRLVFTISLKPRGRHAVQASPSTKVNTSAKKIVELSFPSPVSAQFCYYFNFIDYWYEQKFPICLLMEKFFEHLVSLPCITFVSPRFFVFKIMGLDYTCDAWRFSLVLVLFLRLQWWD